MFPYRETGKSPLCLYLVAENKGGGVCLLIKQAHINRQTKPDMGTENLLHSFATDRKLGTAAAVFFFVFFATFGTYLQEHCVHI